MSWNGSNCVGKREAKRGTPSKSDVAKSREIYWVSGLLVLGLIGVASFFLRTDRETTPEVRENKVPLTIKEVKPAPAPKPIEQIAEKPKTNPKIAKIKELRKLSKEERENYIFDEMKKRPLDLTPKTNRIFRTGTEASLARIFMTQLGDPPPPPFTQIIPLKDEAHLAEILTANNPVLETDTEAQRASKDMVELAKKEMIEYIKDGGSPGEFLSYYYGKLQEAFETRRESMKSFMQVAREDPSIAGEYLSRLNQSLSEKGIKTIQLGERQRKRFGLE